MDNARNYIKNVCNKETDSRDWRLIEGLIDWAQTRPDVMEKLRRVVEKHGRKLEILSAQDSFYEPEINMMFLNTKENPVEKGYYFGQDGKLHDTIIQQSFSHELEHALQDDPLPPPEALVRAKAYAKHKTGIDEQDIDRLDDLIDSAVIDREYGESVVLEKYKLRFTRRIAMLESYDLDSQFQHYVEQYELPAMLAENQTLESMNKVPRSLQYCASGSEGAKKSLQHLTHEHLRDRLENHAFSLNSEPAEDVACPIAGETLEAINREQTTLKEAGISHTEDLSGCLLLVPDNTEANRGYRSAVAPKQK